jgi:hypothetical protein
MADKGVFGIYATKADMQIGAVALRQAGFRATDVAALVPENEGPMDLAHRKSSKSAEGFMNGAIMGGVAGALLGWLFASHVLSLTTMEPLVDAGIAVAVLAGAGAMGALGGAIGGLIGLGRPTYEAVRYGGRRKAAGMLISVHCDSPEWRRRARQVLRQTGAERVAAAREAYADGSAEADD